MEYEQVIKTKVLVPCKHRFCYYFFHANLPNHTWVLSLKVFMPHASRLGFNLHIANFTANAALQSGHPARPLDCLVDVITLWAHRLAERPDFLQREPGFLGRALESLPAAIGSGSVAHRIQLVQAEVLLALYFFCDGRLIEGRYHASAAMTAALGCRLHQISNNGGAHGGTHQLAGVGMGTALPAPQNAVELGERINVFWAAFLLDRCWSVALGSQPSLLDEQPAVMSIQTPLPRRMEDYAVVSSTIACKSIINKRFFFR